MLKIDRALSNEKTTLLSYFRSRASESLEELRREYGSKDYKELAKAINGAVTTTRNNFVVTVLQQAKRENWSSNETLRVILMVMYSSYVVMIDHRNEVWPYDYMTFSRRIGELWEPFCKLCFEYPLTDIQFFTPPLFRDVKSDLTNEIQEYISKLPLSNEQKNDLSKYYVKVWAMVDAGQVQLELDLHFLRDDEKFNVDFKSGFGSNEKGNTNRLLLVASIYKNLEDNHKCVILVRGEEDQNNNYFQTLKRSGIWEAYCGSTAYNKIKEYSGFDIKEWIQTNISWETDFQEATTKHLAANKLDHYLKW